MLRRMASLARTPRRGRGFWYGLAIDVLWPPLMLFTRQVWGGGQHVPRSGGVLLASNHVSFLDPISGTAFVLGQGRVPRYLAKAELWRMPVIGRVLAGGRHIPVHRRRPDPAQVYADAFAALRAGEAVAVYPEGTFTDDAWGWPMRGKVGVARMALATTVPVIPIAHWGGQRVLRRGKALPRLLPRATVHVVAGPPIDLDAYRDRAVTPVLLAEVTAIVMAAITELLAEVRGENPPYRDDRADRRSAST
jgi:1-acyl-sn-glycerol-3-phosphate acyltransferase